VNLSLINLISLLVDKIIRFFVLKAILGHL
jgi:hypothetical protein